MSHSWSLIKDGILLGRLCLIDIDQPWNQCRFHAEPAFERYRSHFDRLWPYHDGDLSEEDLERLEDEIAAFDELGIMLIDDQTGQPEEHYLAYIHDGEAWLRC